MQLDVIQFIVVTLWYGFRCVVKLPYLWLELVVCSYEQLESCIWYVMRLGAVASAASTDLYSGQTIQEIASSVS